jgi:hypothetical protein
MIARDRWPASSLADRAGTAEGAVGSSLPPGSAASIKPVGMICSVGFDIEGWTRVAAIMAKAAHHGWVTFNLGQSHFYAN